MIDLIINDLITYMKVANELWVKGIINNDNVETTDILDLPYTHRANIYFRLNLMRQCKLILIINNINSAIIFIETFIIRSFGFIMGINDINIINNT